MAKFLIRTSLSGGYTYGKHPTSGKVSYNENALPFETESEAIEGAKELLTGTQNSVYVVQVTKEVKLKKDTEVIDLK